MAGEEEGQGNSESGLNEPTPKITSFISTICDFKPNSVSWDNWLAMFLNYVALNKHLIDEEGQKTLLLASLGIPGGPKLIETCKPRDPTDYSFEELMQKCRYIFGTTNGQISSGISFMKARQGYHESVSEFGIRIQDLATRFNFPEECRENCLIAKFIGGLSNK